MLITFPRHYFRYTTPSKIFNSSIWHTKYPGIDKPILIGYLSCNNNSIELIKSGRSVIEWAPNTKNNQTRVKPQNVLYVDRQHRQNDIHRLMCDLPWNLDLRTVNLDHYPEYFI